MTSVQEGTPPLNSEPENHGTMSMAVTDVRLPTFNGNGTKDPEQHWFLCEAVWMVRLVHNADIKKAQMITTLRGHTLDWFMKFYVAPVETPQNTLKDIRAAMIFEFRKPKSNSECITEIKEIKQAPMELVWYFDQ